MIWDNQFHSDSGQQWGSSSSTSPYFHRLTPSLGARTTNQTNLSNKSHPVDAATTWKRFEQRNGGLKELEDKFKKLETKIKELETKFKKLETKRLRHKTKKRLQILVELRSGPRHDYLNVVAEQYGHGIPSPPLPPKKRENQ